MDSTTGATPAGLTIDGWACRDFGAQTGLELGRCAQLGDLQIHVTSGEPLQAVDVSLPVLRWLLGGEPPP